MGTLVIVRAMQRVEMAAMQNEPDSYTPRVGDTSAATAAAVWLAKSEWFFILSTNRWSCIIAIGCYLCCGSPLSGVISLYDSLFVGIAVNKYGEIYFIDNTNVRRIRRDGVIETVLGSHSMSEQYVPIPCGRSADPYEVSAHQCLLVLIVHWSLSMPGSALFLSLSHSTSLHHSTPLHSIPPSLSIFLST